MEQCVMKHIPEIPCPICSTSTVSTWDPAHRDESGQLLALRGCPECDKKFTPFPELKEIPGLTLVQQGAEK